ncbi:hypothetical protein BGZ72_000241 [Mortierella alpina]|nr:hypothetical protein BGZ72_000241 [Mortierella alpina]
MQRAECQYYRCKKGLLTRKAAFNKQQIQIRQGAYISKKKLVPELTYLETEHLLRFHSPKPVRIGIRKLSGLPICFSRRPDRKMAYVCVCGKEFCSRLSIRYHYTTLCAHRPIPPDFPGISSDHGQEDEDDSNDEHADEPVNSRDTRKTRTVRSFGTEFVKAVETTQTLQKQSLELHQGIVKRLMELHRSAKEHILELRQELQEERSARESVLQMLKESQAAQQREQSTGRLALRALRESQAAQQEERQEWSVERLTLLALLETQQKERQENQERFNAIELRLKRFSTAVGDDIAPYRTPSTSEDTPVFK